MQLVADQLGPETGEELRLLREATARGEAREQRLQQLKLQAAQALEPAGVEGQARQRALPLRGQRGLTGVKLSTLLVCTGMPRIPPAQPCCRQPKL